MTKRDLTGLVKDAVHPVQTVLQAEQTVEEAINYLRQRKIDEKIVYFYVIDAQECLQGVVSARSLLLRSPKVLISTIMDKSVIRLSGDKTLEEAMEIFSQHHLLALPVVSDEGRLLGVIDIQLYLEESVNTENRRFSTDAFQFLGYKLEEGKQRKLWRSYRVRMPWILCNMLGGISCAIISHVFELVLVKVIILAMFIPLVLTLTESIAMQSMTQSLQLVRKQRLSWRRMFVQGFLEWRIVSMLAITCGIVVGLLSLFWGEGRIVALTIGGSLTLSISLSAIAGIVVPLLLHLRELDPKVAAGPVVLMFTDIITTSLYLSLATWMLI